MTKRHGRSPGGLIHCLDSWLGPGSVFDGLSNSSLESVIFPCNDQGGREVKGVAHVSEMITHSSCRCSSNVVMLLESNPKLSGRLAILNHVTKRETPSLDRDYAIESKACVLHNFGSCERSLICSDSI